MSISPPVRIGSGSTASGTTCTITTTSIVPVGALIGVWATSETATGVLTSVADGSNPYIVAITQAPAAFVDVAFAASIGVQLNSGATITMTYSTTQTNIHASAFYINGLASVGVLDLMSGISGSAAQSTGTITGNVLVNDNEIVLVFLGVDETGLAGTSVIGNLPYVLGIAQDGIIPNMELWYNITSNATNNPGPTASASWTSAAANWGLTMVSFQQAPFIQTFANTPAGMSGG